MSEKKEHSIPEIANKLYELLEPLESEDRQRAIAGSMAMLGETHLPSSAVHGSGGGTGQDSTSRSGGGGGDTADARAFFDSKKPQTKTEELAVAARYREISEDLHEHTKDDLENSIRAARRNIPTNFPRDLKSARDSNLFTREKEIRLSAYGQDYVDALPDRESANSLKSSRKGGSSSKKKTAKKKTTGKKKASSK